MSNNQDRIFNFSAGPAALPLEVLQTAQSELLNYRGKGMGIMEMSHRSAEFDEVLSAATKRAYSLMGLSDDYAVLFLQGGASHQFAMAPMNFCEKGKPVDIVHSGYWVKKAIGEIKKVGEARIVASTEEGNFTELPKLDESQISPEASYVHYCSNNTIFGTQWKNFVTKANIPTVIDMSSDFLSRKLNFSQFDLIFAGAQKNLGPAGVTLVAIKKELAEKGREDLPKILQYRSHIDGGSRYNTPPTFGIYLAGLVLKWIEDQGGLDAVAKNNRAKADLLYSRIDKNDFYHCPVKKEDRSDMNVVFRIDSGNEELEKKFVQETTAKGFSGLKGHRSVGGLRASIYNAFPLQGVEKLVQFMDEFENRA